MAYVWTETIDQAVAVTNEQIDEIRTNINTERVDRAGLAAYDWAVDDLDSTEILQTEIQELRTAIDAAYDLLITCASHYSADDSGAYSADDSSHDSADNGAHDSTVEATHYASDDSSHDVSVEATHYTTNDAADNTSVNSAYYSSYKNIHRTSYHLTYMGGGHCSWAIRRGD